MVKGTKFLMWIQSKVSRFSIPCRQYTLFGAQLHRHAWGWEWRWELGMGMVGVIGRQASG